MGSAFGLKHLKSVGPLRVLKQSYFGELILGNMIERLRNGLFSWLSRD